jgi:hypothetical protein
MQPCDCTSRPDYFDVHPEELGEFLAGFERLTHERLALHHLYRCVDCDTLWIVDDVTRGPMAVRCRLPTDIDGFDERPIRRELCIRMHGGLSDKTCLFRGCKNHAMKSIAFCVEHQYPQYAS